MSTPSPAVDSRAIPRAMRPAVEIIARLSAERNRLRAENARLRDELRRAPKLADVERLTAERDHLAREIARLKQASPTPQRALRNELAQVGTGGGAGARADGLRAVAERLERAVARLEAYRPQAAAPVGPACETTRPAPRRVAAAAQVAATSGSGMLAGLVRANVQLRASEAAPRPAPAAAPRTTVTSGGVLGGLLSANVKLRSSAGRHVACT